MAKNPVGRRPTGAVAATGRNPGDRSLSEFLSYTLPPGALVISLGFWFGFLLTESRANYFGLDTSTLGFTTTEYLTRSPDALFVPAAVLLIGWLTVIAVHAAVSFQIQAGRGLSALSITAKLGVGIGLLFFGVAFWTMFRPLPFPTHYLLGPILFGASVTIIGYGAWVIHHIAIYSKQRITVRSHRYSTTYGRPGEHEQPLPTWAQRGRIVMMMLVILSVFWAASLHAEALGRGRAESLAKNLDKLPAVIVYSKQSLALDADGVTRERITEPDSAFLFRYTGLRLLVRSSDKYFLIPADWTQEKGVTLVVRDTPDIRFEFTPGR